MALLTDEDQPYYFSDGGTRCRTCDTLLAGTESVQGTIRACPICT
jgi:hypothetical protein